MSGPRTWSARGSLGAAFAGALLLARAAGAVELAISGSAVTGPDRVPVAGVEVDLEVAGRLAPAAATTDAGGRFTAQFSLPEGLPASFPVTALFRGDGFDPLQSVERCAPGATRACSLQPAALVPNAGIAALSQSEIEALDPLRSAEGGTLYVLPYQILPPGPAAPRVDPSLLAASLQLAIATRMQDLDAHPAVFDFEPLDPVGIVPVSASVSAQTPEKAKAVGERLNALGVISGTGLAQGSGAGARLTLTSNFLIMPSDEARSRLLLVHDPDLPSSLLTSAELSRRLNPLWGQSALLALCRKELARARAQGDREGLERLHAYLVAERSRTGGNEAMKLADLQRLLQRVDAELGP